MDTIFEAYLSVDVDRLIDDANKKYKGSIKNLLRDYNIDLDGLWDARLTDSQIYIVQAKKHGHLNRFLADYDAKMVGKARGLSAFDADDDGFVYDIQVNQIGKNDSLLKKRAKFLYKLNRNHKGELDYGGTKKGVKAMDDLFANQPNVANNVAGTVNPTGATATGSKSASVANNQPAPSNPTVNATQADDTYRDSVLKAVSPMLKSRILTALGRVSIDLVDNDNKDIVLEVSIEDRAFRVTLKESDLSKLPTAKPAIYKWVLEQMYAHQKDLFGYELPDELNVQKSSNIPDGITFKLSSIDTAIEIGGFAYYSRPFDFQKDSFEDDTPIFRQLQFLIKKFYNKGVLIDELSQYVEDIVNMSLVAGSKSSSLELGAKLKMNTSHGRASIYSQIAKNLIISFPKLKVFDVDVVEYLINKFGTSQKLTVDIHDTDNACQDLDALEITVRKVFGTQYKVVSKGIDDEGYNYVEVQCLDTKTIDDDIYSSTLESYIMANLNSLQDITESVDEFTDCSGISTPMGSLNSEELEKKQKKVIQAILGVQDGDKDSIED